MPAVTARLKAFLGDPQRSLLNLRGRWDKEGLFAHYSRLSRRTGLDRLYFVLSFDCDTEEDRQAAADVHRRVTDLGITPVYAVPGELLEAGADTYRAIAATGAEFINHGHTTHTYFDEGVGEYRSCFFYDQLPLERVRRDIEEGHATVARVMGKAPQGFRIPHFGTFQKPEQLRFIHDVLRGLGCTFSTSTLPQYGFQHGAAFRHLGLWEFPVTGMWGIPLAQLDSWGFFAAPDRTGTVEGYAQEARQLAGAFQRHGWVGVLNVYVDPSHVADHPAFDDAVRAFAQVATNVTYEGLLKELGAAVPA